MSAEQEAIRLVQPATPLDQARQGNGSRGRSHIADLTTEAKLRASVEAWGRARWPEARVCHELVMDRGSVRLDVAFISPAHLAVVEVKSGYDNTERLLHQAAMARLCSDEVWVACDRRHAEDARLVHYLIPTMGRLIGSVRDQRATRYDDHVADLDPVELEVLSAPVGDLAPIPEMMLALLWVSELQTACAIARVANSRRATHASLIRGIMQVCGLDEIRRMVCTALRAREAQWRADPPIPIAGQSRDGR